MSSKNQKIKILSGNCYKNFPELYDILYQRYFKTIPIFAELAKRNTPDKGTILDLAAGTGNVSIFLLQLGFHVTALDSSAGMLNIFKKKTEKEKLKNYKIIRADINYLKSKQTYDAVCIRQAINYYQGLNALEKGLKSIRKIIKPGGAFVFNAPNFKTEKIDYPVIENNYESGGKRAFVLEINQIAGRRLLHRQDAIVWTKNKSPIHIVDTNSFYMFTKNEFESCLKKAGFSDIKFYSSNLSPYNLKDKTLYCAAKK